MSRARQAATRLGFVFYGGVAGTRATPHPPSAPSPLCGGEKDLGWVSSALSIETLLPRFRGRRISVRRAAPCPSRPFSRASGGEGSRLGEQRLVHRDPSRALPGRRISVR